MNKKIFNFFSFLFVLSIILIIYPATNSMAASGNITESITWHIDGETLFVDGVGEIPDYLPTDYFLRPWASLWYKKIIIAPTITRVGQYAFSGNNNLDWIDLHSTTFLADRTCFEGAALDCIIRLHDAFPVHKLLGPINYSSWESIAAGAPYASNNIFILDNTNIAFSFSAQSYPYYNYCYAADNEELPWTTRKKYYPQDFFQSVCRQEIADYSVGVSCSKEPMTESYLKNIGEYLLLNGYFYVQGYNCYYFEGGNPVYAPTLNTIPRRYVLNIDKFYQLGIDYKLLHLTPTGQMYIYDDLDNNLSTFTFSSDFPAGKYFLIFKFF